jgi:vacuolar protein sorting-associated protein 16
MSFAPNGRFLACFTESSILTVISTTFETKVLDFDTSEGSSQPPLEMKWCGEDSVVLHWKNLGVLMVGPYGDWLRFPYENQGNLYLIPEIDCCRVISDVAVELLQRVPPATALLLRIGSIEPSAMLLDASDAFESGSASSDEAARAITKTGALVEAIEGCTDAAAREFDIVTQKRLLQAASFGMHFSFKEDRKENRVIMGGKLGCEDDKEEAFSMPSGTTKRFVATARKLRILNSLRNPNVGMVVTSAQYDAVSATGIIARLVAVKKPALAASIGKYLGLPRSTQLLARASKAAAYVAAVKDLSDADIAQGAIQMIHGGSVSEGMDSTSVMNRGGYATVAMAAHKAGRPVVANMLLVLESSVADKVPALLSTGSFADAVAVATTARYVDLLCI